MSINFNRCLTVTNRLENENDDLEEPRKVEHWIEFETLDDLKAFEQEIQKEGFLIESYEQERNEEGTYSITISRVDGVDYHVIDGVTYTIMSVAQEHNGIYDGWESPVILKNKPSPYKKPIHPYDELALSFFYSSSSTRCLSIESLLPQNLS